jgi:hypothetical protein
MALGTLREALVLPFSTAECDIGPLVEQRPDHLVLHYDGQGSIGTVWTSLTFERPFAVRFTNDVACPAWMLDAYSRVCEVQDSAWIAALRSEAADQRKIVPPDLKHWVIYFDHVGCWEIVASSVELRPGREYDSLLVDAPLT